MDILLPHVALNMRYTLKKTGFSQPFGASFSFKLLTILNLRIALDRCNVIPSNPNIESANDTNGDGAGAESLMYLGARLPVLRR